LNPQNENGGGMLVNDGTVIRNCIFRNNRTQNAKNGAAIHCHVGTTTIENCLFINNTSTANGGAVQTGGNATSILINCTLANNKADGLGGAIGTGANTSDCMLINTIAYNNLASGSVFNSYGQNANINDGGKITSVHSAIESASTKFTDGDDVNLIPLSREVSPGFVFPSQFIGKITNLSDEEAASPAWYALAEGSICIDAGKAGEAPHILFDLAGEARIRGAGIDIGAYEFSVGMALAPVRFVHNINAFVAGNELHVSGAGNGKQLNLFNINGTLVYSRIISGEDTVIRLQEHGFYLAKVEDAVIKISY
jgi:predicted outer membrane repeat protein